MGKQVVWNGENSVKMVRCYGFRNVIFFELSDKPRERNVEGRGSGYKEGGRRDSVSWIDCAHPLLTFRERIRGAEQSC